MTDAQKAGRTPGPEEFEALATRLRRAGTTLQNDDESPPMSEKRLRHTDRYVAIMNAVDMFDILAALPVHDALLAENKRLREALRKTALRRHTRETHAGPVWNGGSCTLCRSEWDEPFEGNEHHKDDCLLASRQEPDHG